MREEKKRVTVLDLMLVLVSLSAVVLSFVFLWNSKNSAANAQLVVIDSAQGQEVYSLEQNATYYIEGPLGTTVITVCDKSVFFEDSPCPEKTCIYHAPLTSSGQWSACLPNQVMVRIESSQTQTLDAIAQ